MAQFFKPSKRSSSSLPPFLELAIEKLDHQGRGIAKYQGRTVFVTGALPTERVKAKVTGQKQQLIFAQTQQVVTASELRVTPFCQHYQVCGGCDLQHLQSQAQVEHKQHSLLGLVAKFTSLKQLKLAPTIAAHDQGYRRSARFGIQYNKKRNQVALSFRSKSSNDLFEQHACPVLQPQMAALITPWRDCLNQLKGKAALGHLAMYLSEQGVVAVLRHTKPLSAADRKRLTEFATQHQLQLLLQSQPEQFETLVGEGAISYNLPEFDLELDFKPGHFIQVNPEVNRKMIAQAIDWLAVNSKDSVLDLFAGLGNFSLPLAKTAAKVVGVEGVPAMVTQAQHNAAKMGRENTAFYHADLSQDFSQAQWARQTFNKALLDPAREGALLACEHLCKLKCERIVYVSCHPATMARDTKVLLDHGYKMTRLGLIDMFPHTAHMESMALFELS
ncbi:23S rRNA (uracil(1939)-C(5))-methyltransferase RlmD [Motilimonas pumila]|uniref:23S rRNA (uracil(1939)-C(5))-methyltransferase RlmD n=1 Tax=Motilimonas pumila TaxID=2303987 RepID=A0A418YAJ5_9GAMM|nr:23S rRNA (uracil(1939)-C(5))-methyltransferase RlmD [Motilimonas pumila]RJG39984.1 23S rRNA (uracil(1939)-C(5))-methyltransferase RlmD [Motilimonas pumila]